MMPKNTEDSINFLEIDEWNAWNDWHKTKCKTSVNAKNGNNLRHTQMCAGKPEAT